MLLEDIFYLKVIGSLRSIIFRALGLKVPSFHILILFAIFAKNLSLNGSHIQWLQNASLCSLDLPLALSSSVYSLQYASILLVLLSLFWPLWSLLRNLFVVETGSHLGFSLFYGGKGCGALGWL